jgi:allantoate deiminase
MPVNGTRLNNRLARLARIGQTEEGGVTRLSLTPEYMEAEALVAQWMGEAGLTTRIDAVGNLIGRRDGDAPDKPAIMIGSHIDTVINGGRYDGTVGVLGGIEVAQALQEDGIELTHPLAVVAFLEEETTRWGISVFGSRAMLGLLDPQQVLQCRDQQGITMAETMRAVGLDPDRFCEAARDPREIGAYLEMHIEQGAVLDSMGLPIGVVTAIAGPLFLALRLKGRTDHAGATPMNLRRDALVGAAQIVLAAQRVARETSPTCVATVGQLEVKPGSKNAIPGEVFMTLDIRDIYLENRDRAEERIKETIRMVAEENGLEYDLQLLSRVEPVVLSCRVVNMVAAACRKVGVPVHKMPSGAGHDAQAMATATDVGMIFLRSKDGISHAPQEFTEAEDITLGTRVLYETVLALDGPGWA